MSDDAAGDGRVPRLPMTLITGRPVVATLGARCWAVVVGVICSTRFPVSASAPPLGGYVLMAVAVPVAVAPRRVFFSIFSRFSYSSGSYGSSLSLSRVLILRGVG